MFAIGRNNGTARKLLWWDFSHAAAFFGAQNAQGSSFSLLGLFVIWLQAFETIQT